MRESVISQVGRTVMRHMLFAAFVVCLAAPSVGRTAKAEAADGNALTFECASDAKKKNIEILVTNPNGVDKKCNLKCTYTAGDKKSYDLACSGVGVFKQSKKLSACGDDHPKGPSPYSNLKAEGTCS